MCVLRILLFCVVCLDFHSCVCLFLFFDTIYFGLFAFVLSTIEKKMNEVLHVQEDAEGRQSELTRDKGMKYLLLGARLGGGRGGGGYGK